ncbi:MAG: rod shape-determining protein MreD [Bacteroidota bacterium]
MNEYLKHTIRFLILLIAQVFVLNNINLGGYINPFVYILFIMLLPFDIDRIWLLVLGFITGFSVDLFSGGIIGLHTAASVLIAFLRPYIIRIVSSQKEFDSSTTPSIKDMGFSWFLSYSILFVLIHHLYYFFLEKYSFHDFFNTISRILLSTLISTLMIILCQYIEFRPKRK